MICWYGFLKQNRRQLTNRLYEVFVMRLKLYKNVHDWYLKNRTFIFVTRKTSMSKPLKKISQLVGCAKRILHWGQAHDKFLLPSYSSAVIPVQEYPHGHITEVWVRYYDAEMKSLITSPLDGPVVLMDGSGAIIYSSLSD